MANRFVFQDKSFSVGDTINVFLKVVEGEKVRQQIFTGLVIAVRGEGNGKNFILRKIGVGGVGVERILPLKSPDLIKITLKERGRAKRAKLYYLRKRTGKKALKVKAGPIKPQKVSQVDKIEEKKSGEMAKPGLKGEKPREKRRKRSQKVSA